MRMIIMTESSKFGANCVAGINIENGEWVRLVTDDKETHGAVRDENLMTQDDEKCEVLDIVDVPVIEKCDDAIQPENVLMDTSKYIKKLGKADINDVIKIHPAELHTYILGNKYPYVTERKINDVGYSLTLIEVDDLVLHVAENREGKKKTKASFTYNGYEYHDMSVTDRKCYCAPDGFEVGKAYLVVSIGTTSNDKYYKFIANVL